MRITIYQDETYTEIRETRECDRIKIPYRVGQYVVNIMSKIDYTDEKNIIGAVLDSEEQITKIVKATFGLTDDDLETVDMMELGDVAKDIINFVLAKIAEMGIDIDPNSLTQAAAKN